ncbi:MAG: hypothetical protein SFX18_15145 [Pirellulales bacterium]|nr:hypothetical protein [Pirellulales bacterium]
MESWVTIGDLELAVGGRMRWGDLPPLRGEHTPLGMIRGKLSEVLPGDVYWPCESLGERPNLLAEEAYTQGALGVVIAGRRVVPWAGCWSLEVDCAARAWRDWQGWLVRHAAANLGKANNASTLYRLDAGHRAETSFFEGETARRVVWSLARQVEELKEAWD